MTLIPVGRLNPTLRAIFWRWFVEYNPFYLVSAACMLAGLLTLTNSLSWTSIPLPRLLILVATLNIYEAVLIGLGLLLIVRRGLKRDGMILLIIEAFFLVDISFLNAEIATSHLRLGLAFNAILYAMAAAKLMVVMRVLVPKMSPGALPFMLVSLLALFVVPIALKMIDHGSVRAIDLYAVWWIAGLLPAVYELFDWMAQPRGMRWRPEPRGASVARLYMTLPYLSLLLHVSILHYVYNVHFFGACAAPVLLGLTLVINRAIPSGFRRPDLAMLRFLLPVAALIVSANNPWPLQFSLRSGTASAWITPLRLAIAAAYLAFVYCYLLRHAWFFISAGLLSAAMALFGPSIQQMGIWARGAWDWAEEEGLKLMPKTMGAWGILGVAASFVFLMLGAAVSLRKPPEPRDVLAIGPADPSAG